MSSREKPMAISLEGADELVQACDAADVHLFVVKQNRLNAPVQLLKRAIDRRSIRPASIWRTALSAGRGRRSTTTRRRGAGRGSSTAARS